MMDPMTDPTAGGELTSEEIAILRQLLAEYSAGELDELLTEVPDLDLAAVEEEEELIV